MLKGPAASPGGGGGGFRKVACYPAVLFSTCAKAMSRDVAGVLLLKWADNATLAAHLTAASPGLPPARTISKIMTRLVCCRRRRRLALNSFLTSSSCTVLYLFKWLFLCLFKLAFLFLRPTHTHTHTCFVTVGSARTFPSEP